MKSLEEIKEELSKIVTQISSLKEQLKNNKLSKEAKQEGEKLMLINVGAMYAYEWILGEDKKDV